MYDKEEIYDKEIAPLMKRIIEICKRDKLPMVAQFYLKEEREDTGEPMYCTTTIVPAKKEMNEEVYDHLKYLCDAMKYGKEGKPFVMAYTVSKS